MVIQGRKTTTEEERFGGFSSSYSRGVPNTTIVDEPINTTETDAPLYEIEQEYTSNEPKAYEEHVKKMSAYSPAPSILDSSKTSTSVHVNARGKIMLSVYSIIVAILVAFTIYNAVIINNYENQIASFRITASGMVRDVSELQSTYDNLATDNAVNEKLDSTWKDPDTKDTVTLNAPVLSDVPSYDIPSTLFDKICEFLSGLFS
ncbi:MAG: hypothetical protein RR334_03340 [Clostridia bacterium]